ncbi:hypothetical protein M5X00_23295, partial [Paenibacillus alvei]|nr:hypothetical protein [Paenibacillus alvei]
MKLLFFVSSESSYKHLRSMLEEYEVAPFASDEIEVQRLLHDYSDADAAILESCWEHRETAESMLTYFGVTTIEFNGIYEDCVQAVRDLDPRSDSKEREISVLESVVKPEKPRLMKNLSKFWNSGSKKKKSPEVKAKALGAAAEEAKRQQEEQEALLAAQQAEEEAARERAAAEEAKRQQEEQEALLAAQQAE